MIFKRKYISYFFIISMLVSAACSEYQTVLKSSDYNLKYQKAIEYYQNKDYYRALSLLEEILTIYKGTTKGELIYYYYCYCNYYQKDYILAGYHFKVFAMTYPVSKYKEECEYMSAYCDYQNSPDYSLDQVYTTQAINAFQQFVNNYPNSTRVTECNNLIDKLRYKLEIKSYKNSKLYFDMGAYQAAVTTIKNSIEEFPDSPFREDLMFMTLEANFYFAENSVVAKKKERFQNTLTEYYSLLNEFPQSKYLSNAQKIYKDCVKELQ
jgi:outer membrane protein assembly factor BamD